MDDLRDQWMSYAHRAEWTRVMNRLLDAASDGPVSVLSGEIHLAARGTARRGDALVDQFTASGIAHPPPPALFGRVLGWLARKPWRRGDIELEMHPIDGRGRRYLPVRNWMEVAVARDGALDVALHAEGEGTLAVGSVPGRLAAEPETEQQAA